jgi:predicted metallopeptidase
MATKDEGILDVVSTGDVLTKRYGFEHKEVPLANWPAATQKFLLADEVSEIGRFIITKFKKELSGINIGYVFKQKAGKKGEGRILGQAKAESELQRTLHGLDALILIGFDTWSQMNWDEKLRLVHHELCHIGFTPDGSDVSTIDHEVEEFSEVMQHWGPGTDAQVNLISAYQSFSKLNGGK